MVSNRKKPLKRQVKNKKKYSKSTSKTRAGKKVVPSNRTFKVKWTSLAKIVKVLKQKRSRQSLQKKSRRKLTRKESLDLVPMPSFGKMKPKSRRKVSKKAGQPKPSARACKGSARNDQWQRKAARKGSKKSSKTIADLNNLKPKSAKTPFPSSKMPTFIEMVKTAVKDLSKFQMTGRKTISKYVELRYRVRNDELLRFALKWMLKKKILTRSRGAYSIADKKKKKAAKKTTKKKKSKRKKKKKNKKNKKKADKGCKSKCTCSKDMKKKKNLVRVRTRYVRRNGKIYKEDEYV